MTRDSNALQAPVCMYCLQTSLTAEQLGEALAKQFAASVIKTVACIANATH